ncbi:MAG: hypothetical protein AAGJ18_01550 [Bacteroidota bacterium]
MKEQLAAYIRLALKNPKEEDIQPILDIFEVKNFLKEDHFKLYHTEGTEVGFLLSGSARISVAKGSGEKVTGNIVYKHQFIADFISMRTEGKTPLAIDFLEPSIVLVAPIQAVNKLLETNLTFNRFIREYIMDNIAEFMKLYMYFIVGTAKDRYEYILGNNPELLKNIPLHFIAEMIGVTPTQLSRIRNKKIK